MHFTPTKESNTKSLRGRSVLSVMKSGSSRPILIEDVLGQKYVVKLRKSLSNPYAAVSDFLSLRIGFELGLPIIEPRLIHIDEQMDLSCVDAEVRDIVLKSSGWNVAYPFFDQAKDAPPQYLMPSKPFFQDLFLLDVFLLNIDRTHHNTNILMQNDRFWAFDYETSLNLVSVFDSKCYEDAPSVWRALRENPLFFTYTPEQVHAFLAHFSDINIETILAQVPASWLSLDASLFKIKMAAKYRDLCQNSRFFMEILSKMTALDIESAEEKKKRALDNRRAFEEQMKKS
ncbi:MAG: hypothetical protein JNL70_22470 [Saprospiraceae bacterium]|nr:hypothetical protein [Saprospiraceae bacterium]